MTLEEAELIATALFCANCGTPKGRSGKCPALCEPVEQPAPEYTGESVIGRTHIGNIVRSGEGWIG
jgi:hypothetical protein